MFLKYDKTILLIWGQGLEYSLKFLLRSDPLEYIFTWRVLMHIFLHIELGQVVFHYLTWIVSFELDENQFDIL